MFLLGDPERPVSETVKMKPELPWRLHNVGDSRTVEYYGRTLLIGNENDLEKEVCWTQ